MSDEARARFLAGDLEGAATVALREFGAEILGYLHTVTRSESDAEEVFAMFLEDFWRGFADFEWRASVRTWAYTLARNALHRYRRSPSRRRLVPASDTPLLDAVAAELRTTTFIALRTEVKDRVSRLRERLAPDDQELLVFRVGRALDWTEIARIRSGETALDDVTLRRRTAALRKEYQRVLQRLRALARADGLEV